MPYLIDGHNLIARLPDLQLTDPHDEAQLVLRLRGFSAAKRKQLIVIFDKGLPGGYSAMSTHSVKVIFAAAYHTTADRILMERIRHTRDAKNWTVVSSDQEILRAAKQQGMKTLLSVEFAHLLESARPAPVDKSEAAHVVVSQNEIDELLSAFEAAPPVPAVDSTKPTVKPATPPGGETETPPKRKNATKSTRRTAYAKHDEVHISDQDIDAWLGVFERAPAPSPAPPPEPPRVVYVVDEDDDEPADEVPPPPRTPPQVKRSLQKKYGEPHLSKTEIEEWLRLFGEDQEEE